MTLVDAEQFAQLLAHPDQPPPLGLVGGEIEAVSPQPGGRRLEVSELVPATGQFGAVDEVLDQGEVARSDAGAERRGSDHCQVALPTHEFDR